MVGGWISLVLALTAAVLVLHVRPVAASGFNLFSDYLINQENNDPSQLFPPQLLPDYSVSHDLTYDVGDFRIFPPADPNLAPEDYSVFDFRIDTESFPGRVLIGAADKLYILDPQTLEPVEGGELTWLPFEKNRTRCVASRGLSVFSRYLCRNHIRLYERHPTETDKLFICATESRSGFGQCRGVQITENDTFGEFLPEYKPVDRIMSTHPDYPFFGFFRRLNETDDNFLSWAFTPGAIAPRFYISEQTISFNSTSRLFNHGFDFGFNYSWFGAPGYAVEMLRVKYNLSEVRFQPNNVVGLNYDFIYLFIREYRLFEVPDTQDIAQLYLTYVVRICRDDPGVPLSSRNFHRGLYGGNRVFSSLMKARIFCERDYDFNTPSGTGSFFYNEMWAVALNSEKGGTYFATGEFGRFMYAAFSNTLAAQPSSVICVYAASPSNNPNALNSGIFDTFNEDVIDFKTHRANQNIYGHCDGVGRPNQSDTESYVTAEDFQINWRVTQIRDPLVFVNDVIFTKLAVDAVCMLDKDDRSRCKDQDVIFIGTHKGTILKVVLTYRGFDPPQGRQFPVIVEEIALDDLLPVKGMVIEEFDGVKYIIASTGTHVYRLPLERCARHTSAEACISSQDPYCLWNTTADLCMANMLIGNGSFDSIDVPSNILQNVHKAYVPGVPYLCIETLSFTVSENVAEVFVVAKSNDTIPDDWVQFEVYHSGLESPVYDLQVSFVNLTANVRVPIGQDRLYNGVVSMNVWFRNTYNGSALFNSSCREATVTIIDDDGILGQIGIAGLPGTCRTWTRVAEVNPSLLEPINNAILTGINQRSFDSRITLGSPNISCKEGQEFLNSAIYRFTLLAQNIDTELLQTNLAAWANTGERIKLEDNSLVEVDPACNTRIFSERDPTCTFTKVVAAGLAPTGGNGSGGGGTASTGALSPCSDDSSPCPVSVALGVLLAVAVICIAVLLLLLVVQARKKGAKTVSSGDDSQVKTNSYPNSPPHYTIEAATEQRTGQQQQQQQQQQRQQQQKQRGEDETKKDLSFLRTSNEAVDHNSGSATPSPTSPIPVSSAAPLVHDGVETKKNPFHFSLQNPPFGRKDSPRVTDSPRRGGGVGGGGSNRNSYDITTV